MKTVEPKVELKEELNAAEPYVKDESEREDQEEIEEEQNQPKKERRGKKRCRPGSSEKRLNREPKNDPPEHPQ